MCDIVKGFFLPSKRNLIKKKKDGKNPEKYLIILLGKKKKKKETEKRYKNINKRRLKPWCTNVPCT